MKNIIIIFILFFLNVSKVNSGEINQNGEIYNTGTWGIGEDTYVIGCIYDAVDSSFGTKCAHRSSKWYYYEPKYQGSLNRAYQKCKNELYNYGSKKYVNFRSSLNDGGYEIDCSQ
jgi:hypothetical protein